MIVSSSALLQTQQRVVCTRWSGRVQQQKLTANQDGSGCNMDPQSNQACHGQLLYYLQPICNGLKNHYGSLPLLREHQDQCRSNTLPLAFHKVEQHAESEHWKQQAESTLNISAAVVRLRAPLAASQVTTSVTANGSHAFHSHYITTRAAFRMPDKIIDYNHDHGMLGQYSHAPYLVPHTICLPRHCQAPLQDHALPSCQAYPDEDGNQLNSNLKPNMLEMSQLLWLNTFSFEVDLSGHSGKHEHQHCVPQGEEPRTHQLRHENCGEGCNIQTLDLGYGKIQAPTMSGMLVTFFITPELFMYLYTLSMGWTKEIYLGMAYSSSMLIPLSTNTGMWACMMANLPMYTILWSIHRHQLLQHVHMHRLPNPNQHLLQQDQDHPLQHCPIEHSLLWQGRAECGHLCLLCRSL